MLVNWVSFGLLSDACKLKKTQIFFFFFFSITGLVDWSKFNFTFSVWSPTLVNEAQCVCDGRWACISDMYGTRLPEYYSPGMSPCTRFTPMCAGIAAMPTTIRRENGLHLGDAQASFILNNTSRISAGNVFASAGTTGESHGQKRPCDFFFFSCSLIWVHASRPTPHFFQKNRDITPFIWMGCHASANAAHKMHWCEPSITWKSDLVTVCFGISAVACS